jgi:dipeptidyl aminopeptidase/acylaminoacyl peptidase
VLIIHGARDTIVSVDQAHRMVAALQSVNQPHEYLEIPDMEHIFGAIWQTAFGQINRNAALEFLAANL